MCNVNIGRDGHRFREQTKSILVERLKKTKWVVHER